jgi:hypothetical protein
MMLIAPQHPEAERFDSAQDYSVERFRPAFDVPGIRGAWQVWRMYAEAEKLVKQNWNLVLHCGHVNAAIAARKLKRRYGTPYLLWTHALEIMDEWLRDQHSACNARRGFSHYQQRIYPRIRCIGRCAAVPDRENLSGSRSLISDPGWIERAGAASRSDR